jgi:chromosome segregation ATPase
LQKELAVVKSEYSLLKDKSLQDITALKEELHVAKVSPMLPLARAAADTLMQGELRSVKGDASNIGRTAESREKEMDRLKACIKALEETKKTLQADKAAVTGEKMNLELQMKSTGARLLVLEKENEKLREKAGKIGEARSEAQQVHAACHCCGVEVCVCCSICLIGLWFAGSSPGGGRSRKSSNGIGGLQDDEGACCCKLFGK